MKNNNITTYIGSGIILINSSPGIIGGFINEGTTDLYLTEDSHTVLEGIDLNPGKIGVKDQLSSIVYVVPERTVPYDPPASDILPYHGSGPSSRNFIFVLVAAVVSIVLMKRRKG